MGSKSRRIAQVIVGDSSVINDKSFDCLVSRILQ
jgi:transcriptional regulator of NAD metabolism